jgi:lipopolysaccharide/colanic/teichoic acid biosynthesis glycosyltransferase
MAVSLSVAPMKRLFDICIAAVALIVLAPFLLIAAIGIRLTSPGPILYRARRIGRDRRRRVCGVPAMMADRRRAGGYGGREFIMYKFRTMRVVTGGSGALITAARDSRVFPFGTLLRATKIDELPQLVNVLKGEMSLVGPRPEDPEIVRVHYQPEDLQTLQVPPGLTSPGTIYYYTRCEAMLDADSLMEHYLQRVMPLKLALDRVYISRASLSYDVRLMWRTLAAMLAMIGRTGCYPQTPELAEIPPDRLLTRTSASRMAR